MLASYPLLIDAQTDADIIIQYTNTPNGRFGHALAGANVNPGEEPGHRYDDLIVGAPGCSDAVVGACDTQKGMVHVFYGGPLGLRVLEGLSPPTSGPWIVDGVQGNLVFEGSNPRDRLGFSVANLGDIDGDGADDFAAGAPQFQVRGDWMDSPGLPPTLIGATTGYVVVLRSGTMSTTLLTPPPIEPQSDNDVACFGMSIASIGDVDEDDVPDFVVGAPATKLDGVDDAGSAFVYKGDATPQVIAHVRPPEQSDPNRYAKTFFAWTVAGLGGDVSFPVDGIPDWVASAHVFSDTEIPDDNTMWMQCPSPWPPTWPGAGIGGVWAGRAFVMSGDRLQNPAFPNLLTIGGQDNLAGDKDKGRLSLGMATGFIDSDGKPDLVLSAFALKNEESPGPVDNGRVYLILGARLQDAIAQAGSP